MCSLNFYEQRIRKITEQQNAQHQLLNNTCIRCGDNKERNNVLQLEHQENTFRIVDNETQLLLKTLRPVADIDPKTNNIVPPWSTLCFPGRVYKTDMLLFLCPNWLLEINRAYFDSTNASRISVFCETEGVGYCSDCWRDHHLTNTMEQTHVYHDMDSLNRPKCGSCIMDSILEEPLDAIWRCDECDSFLCQICAIANHIKRDKMPFHHHKVDIITLKKRLLYHSSLSKKMGPPEESNMILSPVEKDDTAGKVSGNDDHSKVVEYNIENQKEETEEENNKATEEEENEKEDTEQETEEETEDENELNEEYVEDEEDEDTILEKMDAFHTNAPEWNNPVEPILQYEEPEDERGDNDNKLENDDNDLENEHENDDNDSEDDSDVESDIVKDFSNNDKTRYLIYFNMFTSIYS